MSRDEELRQAATSGRLAQLCDDAARLEAQLRAQLAAERANETAPPALQCAGCRKALVEGVTTTWCSSGCSCLGAVWCIECWNKHIDRREVQGELRANGCPCASLDVAPCNPQCTCRHAAASGGCRRCCRYGSKAQVRARRLRLAALDLVADAADWAAARAVVLLPPDSPCLRLAPSNSSCPGCNAPDWGRVLLREGRRICPRCGAVLVLLPPGSRKTVATRATRFRERDEAAAVEAFQIRPSSANEWPRWLADAWAQFRLGLHAPRPAAPAAAPEDILVTIVALDGAPLSQGDWIVRDARGELYPCTSDTFAATLAAATYQAVPNDVVGSAPRPDQEPGDNDGRPDQADDP